MNEWMKQWSIVLIMPPQIIETVEKEETHENKLNNFPHFKICS